MKNLLLKRLPAVLMIGAAAAVMGLPIAASSVTGLHGVSVTSYASDPGGDCCARADTVDPFRK
ncbi:hypothetical protein [Pseudonocardia sp. TRM90224]|uniref:hypothetical protein n=1 Tax=Pseudonocardia sp. TRM90224 TaxID=2812678 RepID=UPI001E4D86D6|nr:hypothetical protein [Pseudonocardia sp. TRM90224]